MKWKEVIADYLTFTRKERIGIITVLSLITIAIFLPAFFSYQEGTSQQTPDTAWITAIKKLEQNETYAEKTGKENESNVSAYQFDPSKSNYNNNRSEEELFHFDPNTLSKEGWQKLGLRDKTIQTIQNYLSKGGRFKKPEDLQRIYGLHEDEYEKLAPFVKIETLIPENKSGDFPGTKNFAESKPDFKKTSRYTSIDINTADTTGFIGLPGIGSKLAARIVNFRDKLGGFYEVNQVKETFGLPDSTFQKIRQYLVLENNSVKKISINTATIDELKVHPYIRYNIANAIVAYRNQHGLFTNADELKKIMLITDEVYQKIIPYLSLSVPK